MIQPVDLSKVKVGDEVTVRAFVASHDTHCLEVRLPGCAEAQWTAAQNIVSHTPAPPKELGVGDRVKSGLNTAKVLALRGRDACIVFDVDPEQLWIRPLRLLERVDV